jgi:hypothetical protein
MVLTREQAIAKLIASVKEVVDNHDYCGAGGSTEEMDENGNCPLREWIKIIEGAN